jgi:hypothetical protein
MGWRSEGWAAVVLAADPADGEWKIADGRHHYRICKELGYVCKFERFAGSEAELYDFAEARGLNRRHLSETQRAAVEVRFTQFRGAGRPGNSELVPNKKLIRSGSDGEGASPSDRTQAEAAKKAKVSVPHDPERGESG